MTDFNQTLTMWLRGYLVGRGLTVDQARDVVVLRKTPSLVLGDVCFDLRRAARILGLDANTLSQEIAKATNL